jgi:hypothetical protein
MHKTLRQNGKVFAYNMHMPSHTLQIVSTLFYCPLQCKCYVSSCYMESFMEQCLGKFLYTLTKEVNFLKHIFSPCWLNLQAFENLWLGRTSCIYMYLHSIVVKILGTGKLFHSFNSGSTLKGYVAFLSL